MHVWDSVTTRRQNIMEEGIGRENRVSMLVFLRDDCLGEVLELTQGLTMMVTRRSALPLRLGWLPLSTFAFVATPIRKGLDLPCCRLARWLKGRVSSTTTPQGTLH